MTMLLASSKQLSADRAASLRHLHTCSGGLWGKRFILSVPLVTQAPSSRFAAFIASPSAFDAAAFGMSLPEATLTDPQQRLLLESVAVAVHAKAASRRGSRQHLSATVGVFVGIAAPDYAGLAQAHSSVGPYGATGTLHSRLARHLLFPSRWLGSRCHIGMNSGVTSLVFAHDSLPCVCRHRSA